MSEAIPSARRVGDVAASFQPEVVQMAAAALQIQRDTASIAAALEIIHGGNYRVEINHEVEYVLVRRS